VRPLLLAWEDLPAVSPSADREDQALVEALDGKEQAVEPDGDRDLEAVHLERELEERAADVTREGDQTLVRVG
jgi:hypothetical protein